MNILKQSIILVLIVLGIILIQYEFIRQSSIDNCAEIIQNSKAEGRSDDFIASLTMQFENMNSFGIKKYTMGIYPYIVSFVLFFSIYYFFRKKWIALPISVLIGLIALYLIYGISYNFSVNFTVYAAFLSSNILFVLALSFLMDDKKPLLIAIMLGIGLFTHNYSSVLHQSEWKELVFYWPWDLFKTISVVAITFGSYFWLRYLKTPQTNHKPIDDGLF